jgi:hypothetical protein
MDDTPGFVATIEGAPRTLPVAPTLEHAPARALAAPTREHAPASPARPRTAYAPPRPARAMSRILLLGIAAAIALYAAGVGGDLLGMIRGGASARAVPVEGGSLLRARALTVALHGLPRGKVEALRVAAGRLDARVVVGDRLRLVRIDRRGRVTELPAPSKPSGRSVRVDPRAPARIIRAVTARTGRAPGDVAFLELDGARWQLVFDDGRQFSADVHGREVRAG